ncbi:MAG: hypothetical protein FD160_2350 [Caulobacteraceae bacterium]|nr:MAG: hypothetical protein FD160_2350 [Caulobacteraceae bacterium]
MTGQVRRARQARTATTTTPRQPELFDLPRAAPENDERGRKEAAVGAGVDFGAGSCAGVVMTRPRAGRVSQLEAPRFKSDRTVSEADLPGYPSELADSVEQAISNLPTGQVWFTYRDIRTYFGVSRPTVARRMKAGLVPGIRFIGDRVVEDGSVRRFDRTQLHWILLSVRASANS